MASGIIILLVVVAVFAGIFLAGLYGDVVVGAAIVGIAVALEAAARMAASSVRTLSSPLRRSAEPAGTRAASPAARLP